MNKKKKSVNKKHRKTKTRLKALKVASLVKMKKRPASKPLEKKVETVDAAKETITKKTVTKKTVTKKTVAKKVASTKKVVKKKVVAKKTTTKK